MKSLFGETGVRILALGALVLGLILAVFVIQILLVPFVAALFVVYLFDPAVLAMQRKGIDRGHAFYTRLLTKSDTDLQAGNLSREEVEEGLEQLQQMDLE